MSHHRLNIEAEIHEFIANRWSPRSFSKKPISENDLKKLFEAARWAPSSSNDQPWAFIVARQGDGHYDRLFEALVSGNQKWAYTAPVLVATLARKNLTKGEGKNTHAWHDLGLAMGNLSLQATTMGIQVHQMGGIIPAKLIENFEVDEDTWDVVTMFVLGY